MHKRKNSKSIHIIKNYFHSTLGLFLPICLLAATTVNSFLGILSEIQYVCNISYTCKHVNIYFYFLSPQIIVSIKQIKTYCICCFMPCLFLIQYYDLKKVSYLNIESFFFLFNDCIIIHGVLQLQPQLPVWFILHAFYFCCC